MITERLKRLVKAPKARVFRRAYIKRMLPSGAYEDDWLEITGDIKKWGKITRKIDSVKLNKFNFSGLDVLVDNNQGKYNDKSDFRSLWFGFATQQRTQFKVEMGFVEITLGEDGIYYRDESPGALWDVAEWDDELFDLENVAFKGVIGGDISFSDRNEVPLPIMPLVDLFRNFPARKLTGFTSTGMTASRFVEMVRDQQDGNGNYIFLPFFENSAANFYIEPTTTIYTQLNTSTAEDLVNLDVWGVIEKLQQSENFVTYIDRTGIFNFRSRASLSVTPEYKFYGLGEPNREWGQTIKKIDSFGEKFSKFYSGVKVKFRKDDTFSSYQIVESTVTVSGDNLSWTQGYRTLDIENLWIPDATTAAQIAQSVYGDVSALKREIKFQTTFIPGLEILNRVSLNYDGSSTDPQSLWDVNNWGDTTSGIRVTDLIWDGSLIDSFFLDDEEMDIISIEEDLDNLQHNFICRET